MKRETETILTDLFGQSLSLRVLQSVVPIAAPGVAVSVAGQQPTRLALVVCPSDATVRVSLSLVQQTMPVVVDGDSRDVPLLIHASSYPLLVSLPWYAVADDPVTLTVYQVLREQH